MLHLGRVGLDGVDARLFGGGGDAGVGSEGESLVIGRCFGVYMWKDGIYVVSRKYTCLE